MLRALIAIVAPVTLGAQQPRADLILVNGRVLTVDSADHVAQAVGIAGNRIVVVGTTAELPEGQEHPRRRRRGAVENSRCGEGRVDSG